MSLSGAEEEGTTRGKEGVTWGEGPRGQRAAVGEWTESAQVEGPPLSPAHFLSNEILPVTYFVSYESGPFPLNFLTI